MEEKNLSIEERRRINDKFLKFMNDEVLSTSVPYDIDNINYVYRHNEETGEIIEKIILKPPEEIKKMMGHNEHKKAVRLYPNGSWDSLDNIKCNICLVEKEKTANYKNNKYTCNDCTKEILKSRRNVFIKETDNVARKYNNNEWTKLDKIVCNKCNLEKDKLDNYAKNRYTCKECVKITNRENHKKYAEKSKEYSKKYRESAHGSEREKARMREYYLKRKAEAQLRNRIENLTI